jgi:hypothetical protein
MPRGVQNGTWSHQEAERRLSILQIDDYEGPNKNQPSFVITFSHSYEFACSTSTTTNLKGASL